ncbi:MAG: tryptophan 7-halogenase [Rubrivivax sp.]|nr:MAG: tryptophan 7-halogenase [Rubrivivax sp.]
MSSASAPPRRIVILGGGAAGWMSAATLTTAIRSAEVVLVESEEIGIIGVGEATFPSIRTFNQVLGIDEGEFLAATRGSYKLGIQFCDWHRRGEQFFHTFGNFGYTDGPMALWGQLRRLREHIPAQLGDFCLPAVMASKGRFLPPSSQEGLESYGYAYHFDAARYAAFLRQWSEKRGARRIEGRVAEVARREDGGVRALRLADGREIEGDLFVDCSGFASLLIGQTLSQRFIDYSHWLPVDRAWAVPSERPTGGLTPYTRAVAQEAGWTWRIPLQDRTGNGHVFSSRYIDETKAREQLLAQLDAPALAEPRLLRFQSGHRERFWVHNVVAIGLAGGFLEPLESTAIYLVQTAIGRLVEALLDTKQTPAELTTGFNIQQLRQYQRLRDFLILHYHLSERRDSEFWRAMTSMALPESLAYKLHAWQETGTLQIYDNEAFEATSWLTIHAGMDNWPRRSSPWLLEIPADVARRYLAEHHHAVNALAERMPDHDAFLRHICARAQG